MSLKSGQRRDLLKEPPHPLLSCSVHATHTALRPMALIPKTRTPCGELSTRERSLGKHWGGVIQPRGSRDPSTGCGPGAEPGEAQGRGLLETSSGVDKRGSNYDLFLRMLRLREVE